MANKVQISRVQYNMVHCCPQRLHVLRSVSTKDHDHWAGPTLEVCDSQTFHQIWQIWLAKTMKRKLSTCSENWVQAEVATLSAGQKEHSFWAAEWTWWGRPTRLLAAVSSLRYWLNGGCMENIRLNWGQNIWTSCIASFF